MIVNFYFRFSGWVLRQFFHLLYHQLAWAYDFVAWTVSLGRWKEWVYQVIPYLEGDYILELGHGPGYLQEKLAGKTAHIIGIDLSSQMGHLAHKLLRARAENRQVFYGKLIRAKSQLLPFPSQIFTTIVATFPSEFIFDPRTAEEISRTLTPNGRLVVLLSAWLTGKTPQQLFINWLFKITGQSPPPETLLQQYLAPYELLGFEIHINFLKFPDSHLLILTAFRKN